MALGEEEDEEEYPPKEIEEMKWTILINLLVLLLKQLKPENVEEVADKGLDFIEERWSDNKPAMVTCKLIRDAFSIEDND